MFPHISQVVVLALACLLPLTTPSTAFPTNNTLTTTSEIAFRSRPFHLLVKSPSLPHTAGAKPLYLSCSGIATATSSKFGVYSISDTPPFRVMYCSGPGDNGKAVGAGNGALSALVTGLQGKDSVNDAFSIDEDKKLQWVNTRFTEAENGKAEFAMALDGTKKVYAFLGGFRAQIYVDVELVVEFL